MAYYCGIDLHSNNHVVVVIDDEDNRVYEKRLANDLTLTLRALERYKALLYGIAVESTFNWYWLVDGLQAVGLNVMLVNTVAVTQYDGLKYSDDKHDAYWLAHLMRLGILPTGYIYPKAQRSIRDLLRRRAFLVRLASSTQVSIQNQVWRSTGIRVSCNTIRRRDYIPDSVEGYIRQGIESELMVLRTLQQQVKALEGSALDAVRLSDEFKLLQTIVGVGPILGLTIMLEVGDISRFASAGNFASYCRCVDATRLSNGKKKGTGNAKAGNKYLSWAFSEAAHFMVRYDKQAKRFYDRKMAKTNGIIAIRAVARKLARATWMMLKHQVPYEAQLMFGR